MSSKGQESSPNVWKLEGVDDPEAARNVVAQARAGGRDRVGIIVLGRGEDETRVRHWLSIGAQVDGVIGFAVGRTVFWQPLLGYKDGSISRDEAVSQISGTYHGLYRLFVGCALRRTGSVIVSAAGRLLRTDANVLIAHHDL